MAELILSRGFALPATLTALSPLDTMHDGSDERYLQVGLSALDAIAAALLGSPAPSTILDLPCGFGRVTRMLHAKYPNAAITVCDLDRAAVDFTKAAFGARGAYSTANFRDLNLGGRFDLIWVGSLLTHLPEHQTRQFLDFAERHMEPGGRLVVTSHGEYVAERLRTTTYGLTEAAACGLLGQYLVDGYAYRGYSGNPDYGISLAARSWYETLLDGSALRLATYTEQGWDRHQDVLVIRRAARGGHRRREAGRGTRSFECAGVPLPRPAADQAALDHSGAAGFDEAYYRQRFTDVAAAVAAGAMTSAWSHYLAYGWREGRPPFDPAESYAARTPPLPGAWFDGVVPTGEPQPVRPERQPGDEGAYWMAHPAVQARSNLLASGDPHGDVYSRLALLLQTRDWTLPIPYSVFLGYGLDGLKQELCARAIVRHADVFSIDAGAEAVAPRGAWARGLLRLRHRAAAPDIDGLEPNSVDVVFTHSLLHRVERLEALCTAVRRALRPGGIFHLNEFIGPTGFQWTDEQLRLANIFLDSLPERLRRLPGGEPKPELRRPAIADGAGKPSGSMRSSELVETLQTYFDIVENRPLGGALIHIALGGIAQNFDPTSLEDCAILERLFAMEDAAMADGSIGSDFAAITAIPKARPSRHARGA